MAEPFDPPADIPHEIEGGSHVPRPPLGAVDRPSATSGDRSNFPPPPKVADQARLPQIDTEATPDGQTRWWSWAAWRQSSSFATSFLFHFFLLLALALLAESAMPGADSGGLTAYTSLPTRLDMASDLDLADPIVTTPGRMEATGAEGQTSVPSVAVPSPVEAVRTGSSDREPVPLAMTTAETTDWTERSDTPVAGALRGRQARGLMVKWDGGSDVSEAAVERGLRWLAAHQKTDGGWNFNHDVVCHGLCRNPGTESSTTAATGIALMAFLGAGYTHVDGQYMDVVRRGLYYLTQKARVAEHGVDLQEGTMYAQGLATIALCEAYGMTDDPALKNLAQRAIDFIAYAQDPRGGGWRYMPQEPGDTTVTGWQLMALKSGQMAGLEVPSPTLFAVHRFLRSVESEGGARYGYLTPESRDTTTAVGLLCRMYTGWRPSHPGLQKGVAYLGEWGPSDDNMYFDYYATQVMHHFGGAEWKAWNRRMHDHLVATQATTSHEAGSWYFGGGHGEVGGRLYNTAMAIMILEVYYRYMPLYRQGVLDAEF